MLPKLPREIQAASDKGISLFAGEAESHLDDVLRDAYAGKLKPIYNFMNEGRSLENSPPFSACPYREEHIPPTVQL